MSNKGKYIATQNINYKIQNKQRGEILYYSIDQVANLLNENVSNIKYCTNIFDDLLKIKIVDKELRFSTNDVDKLEFLMKLKNRGMSIKEIQEYYNKLPSNDTEIKDIESNLLSVEELIDSIKEEQQIQLSNFKDKLINDIQNDNSLYLQNITSTLIETQNKNLNEFKNDLYKEIENYINSKFDNINEVNLGLQDKLVANAIELISKKIDNKNDELKVSLQNDFNAFYKSSLDNNERLIKEVKSFKKVMHDAYYTHYEVESNITNSGFLSKLFQIFKNK